MKRKKVAYAESSSSDDDTPLASSPAKVNGRAKPKHDDSGSESVTESEALKKPVTNGRSRPPRKKVKAESDTNDDDKPRKAPRKPRKRQVKANDSDAEDNDEKVASSKPRQKVNKEEASSTGTQKPKRGPKGKKDSVKDEGDKSPVKGKGKKNEKEEDENDVFKWWENAEDGDGSIKWNTLEHNGVFFPPPYEPLPEDVKMLYNGMFGILSFPCCPLLMF